MTDQWNDDELTRAFSEWREDDARSVPSFEKTLEAARAKGASRDAEAPPTTRTFPGWLRAAAALVLVVGGGWAVIRSRMPATPIVSITEWRSPTDFLLTGATDPLLSTRFPTATSGLTTLGAHAPTRSTP
jgi:hypothetical protein